MNLSNPVSPFEKATTAEFALIKQGVVTHNYAADQLIFAKDGENTADLFILRKGRIALSDGHLWVDSKFGQGATFTLPLREEIEVVDA